MAALGPKSHGVTPLHLAAKGGHVKVMDKLLEHGANIDARTKGACGCKYIICCHVFTLHHTLDGPIVPHWSNAPLFCF